MLSHQRLFLCVPGCIRDGTMKWEEVNAWRLRLHEEFDTAFAKTGLPERPDYAAANDFLVKARHVRTEEMNDE